MTSTTQAAVGPASRTLLPVRWILGPLQDLLLFLATPLLILPAVLVARQGLSSATVSAAVMAFGAMGHHLPGMLRAYGDRALFARFRTRFLLSPLVLVALCVAFAVHGNRGMVLIAYLWGVWHGWMQTYGFVRIYDAKVGSFGPRVARWDFALCAGWFVGGVLASDVRVAYLLDIAAGFGVAAPTAGVDALRTAGAVALAALTLGYAVHLLLGLRAGRAVNPLKLLLMTTSFGWWWYANVFVADVLIGLILFEIFHDVQYLSIVWLFNRDRAARDPGVGDFTRFLFRRSWGLVALYVAMVFAYGGLGPLAEGWVAAGPGVAVAQSLVTASTLLHFYFDGFLWKVREAGTRQSLGIAGGGPDVRSPWVSRHALLWLMLLLPAGVLWFGGRAGGDPIADARAVATACPGAAEAWCKLGTALGDAGRHDEAVPAFDRALALVPDHEVANVNVVTSCFEAGRMALAAGREAEARPLLARAGTARPQFAQFETAAGHEAWQRRQLDAAVLHLRAAVLLDADFAPAHLNLALALRDRGDLDAALRHAEVGARLLPADGRAAQLVAELRARSSGR